MEREGYQEKEQGYLEKVSVMGIQIADLKSNNEGVQSYEPPFHTRLLNNNCNEKGKAAEH